VARYILHSPGLASRRWLPVSSDVRPQNDERHSIRMVLTRNTAAWRILALSLALYIASLVLPVYQTAAFGGLKSIYGFEALLAGPLGFIVGHFSWAANLLLWASWAKVSGEDRGAALLLACLAVVVALQFLMGKTISAGYDAVPYRPVVGYYVWLASMGVAAIAARLFDTHAKASGTNAASREA